MRLYLETSVPNFLFVDDAPDKRRHTERLFEEISQGRYEAWISILYSKELNATSDLVRRQQLQRVIGTYRLQVLPFGDQAQTLTDEYIAAGAFTPNNLLDAQHVAVAVLGGCTRVVSWNFRHIVREWTIERVDKVNLRLGLPSVVICTPKEVIGP